MGKAQHDGRAGADRGQRSETKGKLKRCDSEDHWQGLHRLHQQHTKGQGALQRPCCKRNRLCHGTKPSRPNITLRPAPQAAQLPQSHRECCQCPQGCSVHIHLWHGRLLLGAASIRWGKTLQDTKPHQKRTENAMERSGCVQGDAQRQKGRVAFSWNDTQRIKKWS